MNINPSEWDVGQGKIQNAWDPRGGGFLIPDQRNGRYKSESLTWTSTEQNNDISL